MNNVLLAVVGGLIVAIVGGAIRYIAKNLADSKLDRVVLESQLTASADARLIQLIGCPGIVLSITCRSKRIAKIKKAYFSVVLTPDDLAAFEKGFQNQLSLGQLHNPNHPPPQLQITLIPLSKSTNECGFTLERDDTIKFFFPIALPALPLFLKATADNFHVGVIFFDESTDIVEKGRSVQEMLRGIVNAYGNLPMQLKVQIMMEIKGLPDQLPPPGPIGMVNQEGISFENKRKQ